MTIAQLTSVARDKTKFNTLQDYTDFCQAYLEFVASGKLQAVIVARNENHYQFWQYGKSGNYQITRPINSHLMLQAESFGAAKETFSYTLRNLRDTSSGQNADQMVRSCLNNTVYTIQQSIGAALDALPAGASNTARKINGDLFERLIRLVLVEMGVRAETGTVKVPVVVDDQTQFKMNYQHDLIIEFQGEVRAIGSVKTSSKDRIDKIFIDKFLYSKLTESDLPHIAIFLNDVQRAGKEPDYRVGATFLPGHFKGYTIKLNPLDGVYYCDIRPNMKTDTILKKHIKTFDHLLCSDIWRFLNHKEDMKIEVEKKSE